MTLLKICISVVFLLVMLIFVLILMVELRKRRTPRIHGGDDSA